MTSLPHLVREHKRGQTVWFVRIGHGPRTRLRAPYGSQEFFEEYRAALAGAPASKAKKPGKGTFKWLIEQYQQSAEWAALSSATRKQRGSIFNRAVTKAGDALAEDVGAGTIRRTMDDRKDRPHAARNFLEAMRGLFGWAVEAQHLTDDPTIGIKAKRPKGPGFRQWEADEIAKFELRWPRGTRERLAFDIVRHTGLRRGDVARLGRQHIKDGVLRIKTEKTGQLVELPVADALQASMDACPSPGLTFICQGDGSPLTKEGLGNWFRKAVAAAGLKGLGLHGIRKAAASQVAEGGGSTSELNAMFGWRGHSMASLYTEAADRSRLARQAVEKMQNPSQVRTDPSRNKKGQ
jgi:integrase